MDSLTPQQERICSFVASYRDRNGVSPVYSEVGDHLGVTKQAVQYQVKALEAQGYLHKPRDARSLMVTPQWKRYRRHQLDRSTNPLVPVVAEDRPELFATFDENDWQVLYGTRGMGGALTREGVIEVAQRLNENRLMRQRAAELLENGGVREELIDVISELWERVTISPGKGRKRTAQRRAPKAR